MIICRFHLYLLCLVLLSSAHVAGAPSGAARPFEDETRAPPIQAELLALGQVGGPADQWLTAATFAPNRVTYTGEHGLKVELKLEGGSVVSEQAFGNMRAKTTPRWSAQIPDQNGGLLSGGITYGFRQVQAALQQPFLAGKGWQLWGWNYAQAKEQNLMADSRIRFAEWMPNGNILCLGWCDGGNTVLGRDPQDLTKPSPYMGYLYGGGRGTSVLLTELTPRGQPLHQAFLGVAVGDVRWDRWGRSYIVGCNMCGGMIGPFVRSSSGSVLILSHDLRTPLLDIRLGGSGLSYKDNAWVAASLSEEQGLLAIAGWTAQSVQDPLHSVQSANGGDRDGLYALIRLWPALSAAVPGNSPAPSAGRSNSQ